MSMFLACQYGNMAIVQMLINGGKRDLGEGLNAAYHNGHYDIADLLIRSGATSVWVSLCEACVYGNSNFARFILDRDARFRGIESCNLFLDLACLHQQLSIIALMIELGADDHRFLMDYNISFKSLVFDWSYPLRKVKHLDVVQHSKIRKILVLIQHCMTVVIAIPDLTKIIENYFVRI